MAREKCRRCGDWAGHTGKTATAVNSTWWGIDPEGVKAPVCGYCFCQLQAGARWDDEPAHKYMERMGV